MSHSLCPIGIVRASRQATWAVLANPKTYSVWSDAIVDRVLPDGPVQAGPRIDGQGEYLGISRRVRIDVSAVNSAEGTPNLTTHLPFGITVSNDPTVRPVTADSCQVSFG